MINVAKEMEHLGKLAASDPGKRFTRLWEVITSPVWLTHAWDAIRKNRGSQTPGIDNETGSDISSDRIGQLSKRLKTKAYRPKPVRRVYIPKSNGKLRPLGIPTIEDRIVQHAIRMALEPVFEADFLGCSHGFRRNRSPHTALRDVATAYMRSSWIIEGDIVGCFDNIPHGKLIAALKRRIADEKVLGLIWQFLEAGYLEDWVYHRTYSGTPQGGIISPLLCNVFMHELDEFMVKQMKANRAQTDEQRYARGSKEYRYLGGRIFRAGRELRKTSGEERRQLVAELKELRQKRERTPCMLGRHPCKLGYVRYADDFVILVNGSKAEAEATKAAVKEKLDSMGLKLSDEKTKLTHWRDTVNFLGFNLNGRLRKKGFQIHAILSIPPEKVTKVREEIQKVCGWHHIPELDAMRQVSALYRGWTNYYRFASGPQNEFSRLSYFAWWEFAHFLAKTRRMSIAQLIRRAKASGQLRGVQRNGRRVQTFVQQVGKAQVTLDIIPPPTANILSRGSPRTGTKDEEPPVRTDWAVGRSLATRATAMARSEGLCERCGVNPAEQVHHPRAMAGRSWRAKVESDRAQRDSAVALCRSCHQQAHGR
jgi:group II intron reverse transcriptase/maturase